MTNGRMRPATCELVAYWGTLERGGEEQICYHWGDGVQRNVPRIISFGIEGEIWTRNFLGQCRSTPAMMDRLEVAGWDRRTFRLRVRRNTFVGKPCRKFRMPQNGMLVWIEQGKLVTKGADEAALAILQQFLVDERLVPTFDRTSQTEPGLLAELEAAGYAMETLCISIAHKSQGEGAAAA